MSSITIFQIHMMIISIESAEQAECIKRNSSEHLSEEKVSEAVIVVSRLRNYNSKNKIMAVGNNSNAITPLIRLAIAQLVMFR